MKLLKIATAFGLIALPAAFLTLTSTSVEAASAHNSQAGANGDTTNASAPLHKYHHGYQHRN